jgi:4-cresol dehydrogenase (hydroxylating)
VPVHGLEAALVKWRSAIGPENVITHASTRAAAETATFLTTHAIPAIIRPGNHDDVQACVRIANHAGVPIYPVSTGKNWGYGSKAPSADACLMELIRMNQIVDFSEELAHVTVEPGVTQGQLYDFLRHRRSRLWIDASGAGRDSSVVGNTLERGFGHTPYGDHFANVCGLEVVLADGEIVNTGFSRFTGAKAGPLYRWGIGPVLDGLFSQSNLGVVTRMTLWLMPAPEYFQAFYFRCDRHDDLPGLINALRPLRMNGTLRSAMHIANDYKVVSAIQQYPWDVTGGSTPLRPEAMKSFRKKYNCGVWNGSGGLYGTRAQVAEARRLVKEALRGRVARLQFLDDRKLELAARFAKPYGAITGWNLSRALELVRPVYGLMKGIPTDQPLRSCYWRKKAIPEQMDLDRDRCGLLWCAPIAPLEGTDAATISGIAARILLEFGFEPMISLTLLTERTLGCVISITYDRDVAGEDEKALACHEHLLRELNEKGYFPYRLGIQSMDQMQGKMQGMTGYNTLLRTLKDALDPNGILAPGRYEPRAVRERQSLRVSSYG